MSIHIGAKQEQIAPTVLLPGDPLRAKHIAETMLEDEFRYNEVRGMLGYTGRYEPKRGVDDHYVQPGNLIRLMSPEQQKWLIANIVASLKKVPKEIQEKMVVHFRKADQAYGDGISQGLGLM